MQWTLERCVDKWGTGRVLAFLAALNVLLLSPVVWGFWQGRQEQAAAAQRAASLELRRLEWMAQELTVPLRLEVRLGSTPETTRVIEEPLTGAGPRFPSRWPGHFAVRLSRINGDGSSDQICEMPPQSMFPGEGTYGPGAPTRLITDWPQYTGDDGKCWQLVQGCGRYQIQKVRWGERHGEVRYAQPLLSEPFGAACESDDE